MTDQSAKIAAYRRERRALAGELSLRQDAGLALLASAVGWFVLDRESAWQNAVQAIGVGLTAALLWHFGRWAWNFVFVAPKAMHFDNLAAIARLEKERDAAREAAAILDPLEANHQKFIERIPDHENRQPPRKQTLLPRFMFHLTRQEPWYQLTELDKGGLQHLWRVGVNAPNVGQLNSVRVYVEGEAFLQSHPLQVSGHDLGVGTVDIAADMTIHFDFLVEYDFEANGFLTLAYASLAKLGQARRFREPPVDGALVIAGDNVKTIRIPFLISRDESGRAVPAFSSPSG